MKKISLTIISFLFLGAPLFAQAALTDGLVGYWTMNGSDVNWNTNTMTDRSSGGTVATLVNMSTTSTSVSGRLGQGMSFNGGNSYVQMNQIVVGPSFSGGIGSMLFSVSFWVYTDFSQCQQPAIARDTDATTKVFDIYINTGPGQSCSNGDVAVATISGIGAYTIAGTANQPLKKNQWNHVVVNFNTTTMSLYINGVLQSLNDSTIYGSGLGTPLLTLGTYRGASFFKGGLDDVRFYNRVLSPSEIAQLYKQGQTRAAVSPTLATSTSATGLTNGLTTYYSFDGKSVNWVTNTVSDVSGGAGNTVSLNGFSTTTSPDVGVIGQALRFDGGASYISPPNAVIKNTVTPSISMWFKTSTGGGLFGYQDVAYPSAGATQWVPILYVGSDGKLRGEFWMNSLTPITTSGVVNDGKWHHVVLAGNTNTQSMYLDGGLVGSLSGTINNLVMNFNQIGLANEGGSWPAKNSGLINGWDFFNGQIDDVRTYNRTLSQSEVTQLYKQGQTRAAVSPTLATSTSATGLNYGLMGYWTLDGKDTNWLTGAVTDRTGNGLTGALVGMSTTTSGVSGKIGQALKFDSGVGSYVNLGTRPSLRFTQNVTVSAWVYPTVASENNRTIFSFDSAACCGVNYALGIGLSGSAGHFGFSINVSGNTTEDSAVYTPNKWYHLVGTYDGSTINFYSNGVLRTSLSVSTTMSLYNNNIATIGGQQVSGGAGTGIFDGYIDDVRVYNRPLSAIEVTQLYKIGQYKNR